MADLWSIISANYKTVGLTVPSKTPYVAVDPKLYEGSWTGKYADNKTFKITISNVTGFPRQGAVPERRHQQVPGSADQGPFVPDRRHQVHADRLWESEIKNVVTDPSSGQTYLDQAYATRQS
jgi:hypothetical protein